VRERVRVRVREKVHLSEYAGVRDSKMRLVGDLW
jgi:hypothetical protein